MHKMQIVMYVPSQVPRYIHFIHIGVHEDQLSSELIFMLSCPKDYFDNLVHNISVHHEPKTEAKDCIVDLYRIHWGNITIGDRCDRIYAPVQCVQIL